ncbi:MAG: alpha/beta hydrolase [Comamonadaceae bacterium]|nr:MAG: alpha/beta hydrolase [Comamonadaceae bacterium]
MAQEPDSLLQPHLARIASIVSSVGEGPEVERRRAGSLALAAYAQAQTLPALKAPAITADDTACTAPGRRIGTRTYRGKGQDNHLTLVYFHGGGWISGNLDSHDDLLRRVAHQLGCTLIAVDYRLSPEHVMPAALDDAAEVVRQVLASIKDRPGMRLALGGDSSGAHLAAVTAHSMAQDVAGLLLFYPVVRPHFTTRSYIERSTGSLTAAMMKWFWGQYLGRPVTGDALETDDARIDLLQQRWRSAPPPTVVLTAWHDPLCDEGSAYARFLAGAGAEVKLTCANGMPHGFARFCGFNATAHRHITQAVDDFAKLVAIRPVAA